VSVFDHGLLYGDGVFEGIRLYGGNVFRLEEHLERFENSAKAILLDSAAHPRRVERGVCETCRANGLTDGYIRLVVTRGIGDLGLAPWLCSKPSYFVIASKISLYPPSTTRRAGDRHGSHPPDRPGGAAGRRSSRSTTSTTSWPRSRPGSSARSRRSCSTTRATSPRHGRQRLHRPQGRAPDARRLAGRPEGHHPRARSSTSPGPRDPGAGGRPDALRPVVRGRVLPDGTGAEVIPVVKLDGRTIGTGRPARSPARCSRNSGSASSSRAPAFERSARILRCASMALKRAHDFPGP
jgi:hypothetical protein